MRVSSRAGILITLLCCAAAGCGGSDNSSVRIPGNAITPGFFIGQTAEGQNMSIAVDSIQSVFVQCGGSDVFRLFSPPAPISLQGTFAVRIGPDDSIRVSGHIVNDDRLDGSISGDPDCAGDFIVRRCNPDRQECGDDDGDTIPNEIDPDFHPMPRPTATPTNLCGNGEIDGDEECDGKNLDDNTCFDLCNQDHEGGTLSCNANCTYNFSKCLSHDCEP